VQYDPAIALAVASTLAVVGFLLFRPVRGSVWRWLRSRRLSDRAELEDALKHLYDCEDRERPVTWSSLSGALELSADRATELLAQLERMELVASSEGAYRLTGEGRRYALRVIRIHRLWESYFSEETGLDPLEWHREAEYREHRTTPEEADRLAIRMGNPRFDPHGDPIPTRRGDVVPSLGRPMTELPPSVLAEIVHVEDEPHAVYAQLLAASLHPGTRVRVLEQTPDRIRFEADGEEVVLAPILAGNLSVVELPADEAEAEEPFERLSKVQIGDRVRVTGLAAACRGQERRRMLDLGIIPGTVIEPELSSPGGDPVAYRVRGTLIALRHEQADLIRIERLSAA
jgi:DtxR family Mn-dependent transcriptional regulator